MAAKLKDRAQAYYLAKTGVKRALIEVVNDKTAAYDALNEYGADFLYSLVDENRKININKASDDLLKRFFEIVAGAAPQTAGEISAAIMDWRDPDEEPRDNGAESGYYQTLNPPYACKNRDFDIIEELHLVKGIDKDIFNKVKDRITVWGTGAVNINTADKLVLQSLGMSDVLAEKIIHFRNGADGDEATEDDNIFLAVGSIIDDLRNPENLSEEEIVSLGNIIAAGQLCVRSDFFTAHAAGKVTKKSESIRIRFVFDRDKKIRFWKEE